MTFFSESKSAFFALKLCEEQIHRSAQFFLRIAFFASGHQIGLRRRTTPRQRHHMIHGQILGFELQATVSAQPRADFFLPPRSFFQLPGDLALFFDSLRVGVRRIQKKVFVVHKLQKKGVVGPLRQPPSPTEPPRQSFKRIREVPWQPCKAFYGWPVPLPDTSG